MTKSIRMVCCWAACVTATAAVVEVSYGCGDYFHGTVPEIPIAELREKGPEGLAEALRTFDALQEAEASEQVLDSWREAIDLIGGQRTCSASRLYWYTDLEKAQAESTRRGRPILSLRMLGKLTDEYSCANSRFFRTALYSNQEIADYLRDNYVLHWQSVRPVPRVTIDFGDGRTLQRTLTGNSAHYVLASDGQPLDALPGLYSPQAFQAWLARLKAVHEKYQVANRSELLRTFHAEQRNAIMRAWDADIQRLGIAQSSVVLARLSALPQSEKDPSAADASARAVTKTAEAAPLMRFAKFGGQALERGMDDELWKAIADLHRDTVQLDKASRTLMRNEFPPAAEAGRVSIHKSEQENPILRMINLFEDSIALDTVRNEYLLHRRIHERFADGEHESIDALNEWVYAELFLTPSSDPWLGLAPAGIYTALEGGGLRQ